MQRSFVVISLTLFLLCMGCADKIVSDKSPVQCCKPVFSIWFSPESGYISDDDVTITETDTDVRISRGRGDHDQAIRHHAEYNALKEFILASDEWLANAKKNYFSGPWSGTPRDMLIIDSKGVGYTFQGDSVPSEWKRRILSFSRKYK